VTVLITITVPGKPQPKERARLGKHGVYTPKNTRTWEASLTWLARGQCHGPPYRGPVALYVVVVHARPVRRPAIVPVASWATGARCYAITKADTSNVVKAVEDGLNHCGVWIDDNQVAHHDTWSYYAAAGEGPCVEIRVEALS